MPRVPLKFVRVRRGNSNELNVYPENLITLIQNKLLIGSDKLSDDGESWIRADHHYQFKKYFPERREIIGSAPIGELPPPNPGLTLNLEELADLLKDING